MELSEILAAIKALSNEERVRAQEALATPPKDTNLEQAKETDEKTDAAVEESAETVIADIEKDKAEGAPSENTYEDEKELTKAVEANNEADNAIKEEQPTPTANEPIPEMSKSAPIPDTEQETQDAPVSVQAEQAPSLQDEQGGDLPIDYQQIIDGLNAKTLALESENKQLKAKVEGAFGLSSKPGAFTPVNNLYGDTSDIPQMKK